ncbi:MAG: phosphoribosyl-AMP cyclohydrolase [Thermodesulfobacteriota bacterium]
MQPDFDKCNGLVPAIAQDYKTGEILMLAYVNKQAWDKTVETGEAHYYSRSRDTLWHKGGTSGHVQKIREIRLDCDQDTIIYSVHQQGNAACHKGYRSCFHNCFKNGEWSIDSPKVFDPKEVYK